MSIGRQFLAPDGYGSLEKDQRYYFLRNDSKAGTVLFLFFSCVRNNWRPFLVRLATKEFEEALMNEKVIIVSPTQHSFPIWLAGLEGVNFDNIEDMRNKKGKKTTYRQQVTNRFKHIELLIDRLDEILSDHDPLKVIACHATRCDPPQHPYRVQLWFFAYIAHGHNIWALKKPTQNVGHWNRSSSKHKQTKFGRPSLCYGKKHGFPSSVMAEQIVKSYLARCGLGKTMSWIVKEAIIHDFGCLVIHTENGKWEVHSPDNKPYPTYGQFRSVIQSKFGIDRVQQTLYGTKRAKKFLVDEGSFTEAVANLLEGS